MVLAWSDQWCKQDQILKTKTKTKITRPRPRRLMAVNKDTWRIWLLIGWTPLLVPNYVIFQAQNRETINSTRKVAVSFKIIMTTSMTRPCFTTQHQTCKTKTKTKTKTIDQEQDQDHSVQDQHRYVWSQTGLVLRPTVSDHINGSDRTSSKSTWKQRRRYRRGWR